MMLKRYHQFFGTIFKLFDGMVITIAWLSSYWLRFQFPLIEVTKGFPSFSTYAALTPLVVIIWWTVFSTFKVYQSQRMLKRTDEAFLIIRSHLVALLFFITLTYLFSEYTYSRGVMIYFAVLGALLLITFRLILRNILRTLRKKGYNLRHALAVGEGPQLETLLWRLRKFPELGIKVTGVVTATPSTQKEIWETQVLGSLEDFKSIYLKVRPDQLMIALPRSHQDRVHEIIQSLKDEMVDIQLIPDLHEYITLGCEVEDFDGLPVVNLNDTPLQGFWVIYKRLMDVLLSAIALILLFPVFVVLGILIKLSSKGPVFYSQERIGLDGKTFKMYKFRSMKVDAESQTGAVWATQNDNRKTPLGAFMRATSIDEFPQFWNVLIGEMSLVGPRPERPIFVDQFKHQIPHYMLRHKMKAGITGWAQINGWRGDTSLEKRIECDIYYIRNWSIGFDFKILFLTLFKGFVNKNAY